MKKLSGGGRPPEAHMGSCAGSQMPRNRAESCVELGGRALRPAGDDCLMLTVSYSDAHGLVFSICRAAAELEFHKKLSDDYTKIDENR